MEETGGIAFAASFCRLGSLIGLGSILSLGRTLVVGRPIIHMIIAIGR